MARKYGMSTGWKWFWAFLSIIVLAGVIFCLTALIVGTRNNIGFVEQIQTWFGIVKNIPDITKDDVGTATTMLLNIFK